jgi:uncharacterized repeat protein (TIGR01451 family)
VCSDTGTGGNEVTVAFDWQTSNANIDIAPGTAATQTLSPLGAGGCAEVYFEIKINPVSGAYLTSRGYRISATYTGAGSTWYTPTPRQIYVEKLVSQNRNTVVGYSINGVPAGNTWNLQVGETYTIVVNSTTAPGGYNQLETFLNLPNNIFELTSVSTTYTADTSPYVPNPNPSVYANACGWDANPTSPTYRSCIGGDYKAGGTIATTYQVKIIGGGGTATRIGSLVYDFSGSSFHYNSDYASKSITVNFVEPSFSKSFSAAVAGGTSILTFTIKNPGSQSLDDVSFTDDLPSTADSPPAPANMTVANLPNATTSGCGTAPTMIFSPASGDSSLSFSGGTIAAGATCTITVSVNVPVAGTYDNASENLFIGETDTGKNALASLTANNSSSGAGVCGQSISFGTPTVSGTQTISSVSGGYTITDWPAGASVDTAKYVQFQLNLTNYVSAALTFNAVRTTQGPTRAVLYQSANADFSSATQVATITQASSSVATWSFSTSSQSYGATSLSVGGVRYFRVYAYDSGNGVGARDLTLTNISFTGCGLPAQPGISKSFSPDPIPVSGTSTLTFTLTNTNAVALTGVTFLDVLPAGMQVASTPAASSDCGSGSWSPSSGATTLAFGQSTAGTIPASGSGGSCNISVAVTSSAEGVSSNVSGFITTTQGGTGTSYASDTLTTLLPPIANKTFGPNPILEGGTSTLSITLTNPNTNDALSALQFTDTYPSNLVNASTPSATNTCGGSLTATANLGTISLVGGSLAAGGSCTVTVQVTTAIASDYPNSVTASAQTAGGQSVGSSNTASDTLTVRSPTPGLALLKQVSNSSSGPWRSQMNISTGLGVYYLFTVENTGDVSLSNIQINDSDFSLSGCNWNNPLLVGQTDTCSYGPVTAVTGTQPNTATASGTNVGTYTSNSSTATYVASTLTQLGGVLFRDFGVGTPTRIGANDKIQEAGEPNANLTSLDGSFVVIYNSSNEVLAVEQICTTATPQQPLGCSNQGTWSTYVAPGTGYTAYITSPTTSNPLPLVGDTVSSPTASISDPSFNLTGSNINNTTTQTGGVIPFDTSGTISINFGVLRNACP